MATYTIEYHRVWVRTVEAETRKAALQIVEGNMSEEPDAEDYSYSVTKKPTNPTTTETETNK